MIGSDSDDNGDGSSAVFGAPGLYLSWGAERVDYGCEGCDLSGHCRMRARESEGWLGGRKESCWVELEKGERGMRREKEGKERLGKIKKQKRVG